MAVVALVAVVVVEEEDGRRKAWPLVIIAIISDKNPVFFMIYGLLLPSELPPVEECRDGKGHMHVRDIASGSIQPFAHK